MSLILTALAVSVHIAAVLSQIDITGVPVQTVVGLVDGHVTLPCEASRPESGDKLELVLWYRLGSKLPFYTYDARGRPAGRGHHLTDDLLSPRARALYRLSPPGLVLSSLRQLDRGVYVCRADFIQTPSRVGVTNLTLIVPPDVPKIYDRDGIKQLDVTSPVAEGESLTLTCETAGGRPPPRLVWFWRGDLLDSTFETDPAGVVRNVLTLRHLTRADLHSDLSCSATNSNLTAPRRATLRLELLLPPVAVQMARLPHQLRAGVSYKVTCTAHGSRPAARVRWLRGFRPILSGVSEQPSADPNVTVSHLTLVAKVGEDTLALTCQAENRRLPNRPPLRDTRQLAVHYPPQVTLQIGRTLVPSEIKEGNDVYFDCQVQANPPATELAWYHEGRQLLASKRSRVMIIDHSLVLPNVSRHQAGRYTCGATNIEGHNQSRPLLLHVMYLPQCQTEEQTVYFLPGRTLELRCNLLARPSQVRFKWDINGTSTEHRRTALTRFSSTGTCSTIQHRLETDEPAEVRCWGSNTVGLQRQPCVFRLEPAGVPGPLKECIVGNSTITSFDVSCRSGADGGLSQKFNLEVRDVQTQQLMHSFTHKDPVFHVRGLSPGMNYTLHVYASSARGHGPASLLQVGTAVLMPDRIAYSRTATAGPVAAVLGGLVLLLLMLAAAVIVSLRRRLPARGRLKPAEQNPPEVTGSGRDQPSPDLLPTGSSARSVSGLSDDSRPDSSYQLTANYKSRYKQREEELFASAEHVIPNPLDVYSSREGLCRTVGSFGQGAARSRSGRPPTGADYRTASEPGVCLESRRPDRRSVV